MHLFVKSSQQQSTQYLANPPVLHHFPRSMQSSSLRQNSKMWSCWGSTLSAPASATRAPAKTNFIVLLVLMNRIISYPRYQDLNQSLPPCSPNPLKPVLSRSTFAGVDEKATFFSQEWKADTIKMQECVEGKNEANSIKNKKARVPDQPNHRNIVKSECAQTGFIFVLPNGFEGRYYRNKLIIKIDKSHRLRLRISHDKQHQTHQHHPARHVLPGPALPGHHLAVHRLQHQLQRVGTGLLRGAGGQASHRRAGEQLDHQQVQLQRGHLHQFFPRAGRTVRVRAGGDQPTQRRVRRP